MKRVRSTGAMVLVNLFPCFAAVDLGGVVLRRDSLPQPGVVVSLAGTSLSDTTDASGVWRLVGEASGVARSDARAATVKNHLALRQGRIQVLFARRDASGSVVSAAASAFAPVSGVSAPRSATGGFDTLVYSWNGRTILRDTIARDSMVREGIVRRFDTTVNPAITHGYVSDSQGHVYRTVRIGAQTWMAENLNLEVGRSWCYANAQDSCDRFGRLYDWATVMNLPASCDSVECAGQVRARHQGICPEGWHVPTPAEWDSLALQVDGKDTTGGKLKARDGWAGSYNGRDAFGFRGLPAGYRYNGYNETGRTACFWSTLEYDMLYTWIRNLYATYYGLYRNANLKIGGYSLRCLKD